VVALTSGRDPRLHAELLHDAHPVAVAPGRVEFQPGPQAARDLAQRLSAFLQQATGARWTISLVGSGGGPSLAQQGRAAEQDRLAMARSHPLVQAVLAAFPGASIEGVRDATLDSYGLPPPTSTPADPGRDFANHDPGRDFANHDPGRDFAPPDAEPVGLDDDLPQED
jgi:DNA polymerase-3 subunit gamma/tau